MDTHVELVVAFRPDLLAAIGFWPVDALRKRVGFCFSPYSRSLDFISHEPLHVFLHADLRVQSRLMHDFPC